MKAIKVIQKTKLKVKQIIILLAKRILTDNLELKVIETKKKKGKIVYRFTTYFTPHGNIHYNLGRHYEHRNF